MANEMRIKNGIILETAPTSGSTSTNILVRHSGGTIQTITIGSITGTESSTTWLDPINGFSGYTTCNSDGDVLRYISTSTSSGWTKDYVYQCNGDGSGWTETIVTSGYSVVNLADNQVYIYNGSAWVINTVPPTSLWVQSGYDIFNLNGGKVIVKGSLRQGLGTIATGSYSSAFGNGSSATGSTAHAEGSYTKAFGISSHAEGANTYSSGLGSHTEGGHTSATNDFAHAEGTEAIASGKYSHAQNSGNTASNYATHAGGMNSTASGVGSFIHSNLSIVSGNYSAVLGGVGITGSGSNTVYVPNLNINYTPTTNNTLTNVLVRDTDGSVNLRDISTITGIGITAMTYNNANVITLTNSTGGTLNTTINTMSGLTINGNLTYTGQSNNPVYTAGTVTSTYIPNWDNSNIQTVTLSAATTGISGGTTFKNGAVYTMILKQNGTGSRLVTWGSQYKWQSAIPPVLTSSANGVDILTFISDGTSLYGLIAKDFR